MPVRPGTAARAPESIATRLLTAPVLMLAVLLYPSELGDGTLHQDWRNTLNPVTRKPWSSQQEYDEFWQLPLHERETGAVWSHQAFKWQKREEEQVTTVPRNHKKFKEAEARLEKSDFAGAREMYRQCFIESPPGLVGLSKLLVAEEWDSTSFRIKLWERYPNSPRIKAELASAYLRVRRPQQALDILNELVTKTRASRTRIPLLLTRFRAALAAKAYDIASHDFAEIWRSGETHRPARLLRRTLLKELSALGDPRSGPLLKDIETRFSNEPALLEYIAAKWREFRALDKLLDLPGRGD